MGNLPQKIINMLILSILYGGVLKSYISAENVTENNNKISVEELQKKLLLAENRILDSELECKLLTARYEETMAMIRKNHEQEMEKMQNQLFKLQNKLEYLNEQTPSTKSDGVPTYEGFVAFLNNLKIMYIAFGKILVGMLPPSFWSICNWIVDEYLIVIKERTSKKWYTYFDEFNIDDGKSSIYSIWEKAILLYNTVIHYSKLYMEELSDLLNRQLDNCVAQLTDQDPRIENIVPEEFNDRLTYAYLVFIATWIIFSWILYFCRNIQSSNSNQYGMQRKRSFSVKNK